MKLKRTTETRCHDCGAPPDEDSVRGAGPVETWSKLRLANGTGALRCARCVRGSAMLDAMGRTEPTIAQAREEEARRERERPRLVPTGPTQVYAPSDERVREAAATLVALARFAGHREPERLAHEVVARIGTPSEAVSATVGRDRWGRRYRPILPPPAAVRRDQGASPQAAAPEEG